MTARTIMVQGTASGAGKSLLVAALCRILRREGRRVAPFKAVNLSLNAAVTPDGLEIGTAQAFQAAAAGVEPRVEMNPVLLKPEGPGRCQAVVLGRPEAPSPGVFREAISTALARLAADFDALVIEGTGSPAEVNLRDSDLANMHVARLAGASVLLVGDVERGGVFASLVGTLELLEPEDRARVGGLVVNKLRGDPSLLGGGLEFLAARTGVPVLGVVPWIDGLAIPDEDSLALSRREPGPPAALEVAIVRLPHLSNHDEFLRLEAEPSVRVRYALDSEAVESADLAILPGTKATLADLDWLRRTGLAAAIEARARAGRPVLGICGGCQMLGRSIDDPDGLESPVSAAPGLGLLPLTTRFEGPKRTARVRARIAGAGWLLGSAGAAPGYEIHAGRAAIEGGGVPALEILSRNGDEAIAPDGAVSGSVVGTMIHGLLEDDDIRRGLLITLSRKRGLPPPDPGPLPHREREIDRLADAVGASLDLDRIRALLDRSACRTR